MKESRKRLSGHNMKWLGAIALVACVGSQPAHGSGVTEVLAGESEWEAAAWTRGLPSAEDTVYIQDIAKVFLKKKEKLEVHGVRLSRTPDWGGMPTLQIEQSYLRTRFLVVGDGANASGTFIQAGGMLEIGNTAELDFEIGNPANTPTEECYAMATFAAGQAALGDLRFNLRKQRKSRLTIFGVLPKVIADSVTFDSGKESDWQPAEMNFMLSDAGVVPLYVRGAVELGDGDRVNILVDGAKYEGGANTFPLVIAGGIEGKPAHIQIDGLGSKARIEQDDKRLNLVIGE